jgi:hypothetical protein
LRLEGDLVEDAGVAALSAAVGVLETEQMTSFVGDESRDVVGVCLGAARVERDCVAEHERPCRCGRDCRHRPSPPGPIGAVSGELGAIAADKDGAVGAASSGQLGREMDIPPFERRLECMDEGVGNRVLFAFQPLRRLERRDG